MYHKWTSELIDRKTRAEEEAEEEVAWGRGGRGRGGRQE